MVVLTIVEDFVLAAMRRAQYEELDGGAVGASVPGCFGILTHGADVHDCAADLYVLLQEWVHLWLARGIELPVIDGIDLNTQRAAALETYASPPAEPEGTFYEDENALEAAFAEHDVARKGARSTGRRKLRATRSSAR